MKNKTVNFTTEEFYWSGKEHYDLAIYHEQNDGSQSMINDCWGAAATDFWFALTVGHEKALIALSKCFGQGVGVPHGDLMNN